MIHAQPASELGYPVRAVSCTYVDPLDTIWLSLAERLGLKVQRSDAAYASTDGRGTLTIANAAALDADDCLAQMILHEICHGICQSPNGWSPDGWESVDWGLAFEGAESLLQEQTCLRLQHALTHRYGLCHVLAPTTEHRAFYDALGEQSFAEDVASTLAKAALERAAKPPLFPHLDRALEQSAELARSVATFVSDAGPHSKTLLARVQRTPDSGFDCAACGACCREAFDVVELDAADPFVELHGELCVAREGRVELRRPGGRCRALSVVQGQHRCTVYATRPQTCRDFSRGSVNCLEARAKVGLAVDARIPFSRAVDTAQP